MIETHITSSYIFVLFFRFFVFFFLSFASFSATGSSMYVVAGEFRICLFVIEV